MGLFRKILDGLIKTNVGDRGSIPGHPPARTYPRTLPAGEWDEEADARQTMDEAKAGAILHDLDTEEGRLLAGEWIETPQSSNVKTWRWRRDDEAIEIQFNNGGMYRVDPISEAEAFSFLRAGSPGGWYWSEVRIRGTRLGHKKNYVFLSGPSATQPKWMKNAGTAAAHGREADYQSQNPSASAFAKGGLGRKRGKGR